MIESVLRSILTAIIGVAATAVYLSKTEPPDEEAAPMGSELSERSIIAIWERAVQTQMHFNEMCVKSRQLGVTIVGATVGFAIFLFTRSEGARFVYTKTYFGTEVHFHVAILLLLGAMVAVWAVRNLDLGVYHRMLRGAVTFGVDLEEKWITPRLGLDKGMTQAILHYSRASDANTTRNNGKLVYTGSKEVRAETKIKRFYRFVMWSLFAAATLVFYLTNDFL